VIPNSFGASKARRRADASRSRDVSRPTPECCAGGARKSWCARPPARDRPRVSCRAGVRRPASRGKAAPASHKLAKGLVAGQATRKRITTSMCRAKTTFWLERPQLCFSFLLALSFSLRGSFGLQPGRRGGGRLGADPLALRARGPGPLRERARVGAPRARARHTLGHMLVTAAPLRTRVA